MEDPIVYIDLFKTMSLRVFYSIDIGNSQKLPIGSVVNLIRSAVELDPIKAIDNSDAIDRFVLYRIVSELLEGRSCCDRWIFKYPSIVAALALMSPQCLLYNEDMKGKEMNSLIFPYVRLLEGQNRILDDHIVEDTGFRFKVFSAGGKISTAPPKLLSQDVTPKFDDKDSVFRWVKDTTPRTLHQYINFVSSGDRYSKTFEYKDHTKVIQLAIRFTVPSDRSFRKTRNPNVSECKIASVLISRLDRYTNELKRINLGTLFCRSDRIVRIRFTSEFSTMINMIDPEVTAYLLSLIGFRRNDWHVNGHSYKLANIPTLSQLSDPMVWLDLGFTVLNVPRTVYVKSFSQPNQALSAEVVKQGRGEPIVTYR